MQNTRNTFEGGLNQDIAEKQMPQNSYIDANDVTLFYNNKSANLTPINGTQILREIINESEFTADKTVFSRDNIGNSFNVLGVYDAQITRFGSQNNGLVIFVAIPNDINNSGVVSGGYIFRVYMATLSSDKKEVTSLTQVYSKSSPSDFYVRTSVDAVVSGEGAEDVIYFTNQVDPPMAIPCNIDDAPYDDEDIVLTRYENMNPPQTSLIQSGGSMESGTYSFAVRMINSDSNKYTKWSLLSSPVLASNLAEINDAATANLLYSSAVGSITECKVDLTLSFNSDIASNFDYYQVAVVKNTTGTGIPKLVAYTLEPKLKGTSSSASMTYYGDEQEQEIDISEITIDDAPISIVNTLKIKNNFLLLGNVKYADTGFDRGEVVVANTSGYSIDTLSGIFNNNPSAYSISKYDDFYFRDEVYRFAIVYHDEYGNWSFPQTIDFSSSTSNRATADCIDYKFPEIWREPLTTDDPTEIRRMQLQLNDIENHPTWAKGFAILRAKRKKDIQFQTPVVPTQVVMPLETKEYASSNTTIYPANATTPNVETGAQPPASPLGSLFPKNLRHGVTKHIIRGDVHCEYVYGYDDALDAQQVKSTATAASDGQRDNPSAGAQYVHCVFPPNNLYNFDNNLYEPYVHRSSDQLQIVDAQNLVGNINYLSVDESIGSYPNTRFDDIDTAAATYYITDLTDNYNNNNKTKANIESLSYIPTENEIIEYQDVIAGIDKITLNTAVEGLEAPVFGDHQGMKADGLEDGLLPVNQPMGVVVTRKPLVDINYKHLDSVSGLSTSTTGTDIWLSNPGFTNRIDNDDIDVYGTNAPQLNSNAGARGKIGPILRQIVPIANVKRGLSDFRYGGADDFHEFVFTGTYRSLSSSEVSNNTPVSVTVRGGDCSYDIHHFKVSNSNYGLPDNEIASGAHGSSNYADDWNISFYANDGTSQWEVGRPMSYKADAQQISVLLESEIRASYSEKLAHTSLGRVSPGPSAPIPSGIADARTPLLYRYNLDYSLSNSNKIWVPKLKLEESQNDFKARIHYSDQRIYQSRQTGFDRFRVNNFYDLEESHGALTRLVSFEDTIYGIQERAFCYIPIQAQILESATGGQIAVRSADIIGIPQYTSVLNGSRHFRSIVTSPVGFYFFDANNRQIISYAQGGNLRAISDLGIRSFLNDESNDLDRTIKSVFAIYDVNQGSYKIFFNKESADNTGLAVSFNEKLGVWESYISYANSRAGNGTYAYGNPYFVGIFADDEGIQLFTEDITSTNFLGTSLDPYVEFITNDNVDVPKVFDVSVINSQPILATLNTSTEGITVAGGTQSASMNIADNKFREGTVRVPILRDSNGARLRGLYLKSKLSWEDGSASKQYLTSVINKYRFSQRAL